MDPSQNNMNPNSPGGYPNPSGYYGGYQPAPAPGGYYYANYQPGGTSSHHPPMPGFTKVYLGQLPLHITEPEIEEVFRQYCEIGELKIVKGNAQGEFTRTCYAFLDIKGLESFSTDVINKVQQRHPNWKINLRSEYDRSSTKPRSDYPPRSEGNYYRPQQPQQLQQLQPQQMQQPQQSLQQQQMHMNPANRYPDTMTTSPNFIPPNFNNRLLADYSGAEKGKKTSKILVRELWIGGIPEGINQGHMRDIMQQFGSVENLEIFAKFAFVKFRMVPEATNAFEKAARMHELFGKPHGFRVFFSDPEKRTNIVGNHYEYDKQSNSLPILFLGFPPITSSIVDENHMKSICERYGTIVNTYIRKSHSPQTRSYILLTFDNVKNAIKAKVELSKRRDLLGDKRVEVALLLDEQAVMKGRNFDYTLEKFQPNNTYPDKRMQKPTQPGNMGFPSQGSPTHGGYAPMPNSMPYPPYPNYPPNYMHGPMMGMHPGMQQNMGMMPYYPMMSMMPMDGMPPSGMMKGPFMPDQPEPYHGQDMFNIINTVLKSDRREPENSRGGEHSRDTPPRDEKSYQEVPRQTREPDWSGFLFRNKANKVGIDGYAKTPDFNFQDSLVNITHVMRLEDLNLKTYKHILVVEPTNEISKKTFDDYINYLKQKKVVGVAISYKYLLFILPKCSKSQEIFNTINDNELLVVMEDIALFHELKDKLQKSQQKSQTHS